jgi:centrin-1
VVTELGENIPDDELREMVEEADRDQDGFVVFEDFYRIMKKPSDDDDDVS